MVNKKVSDEVAKMVLHKNERFIDSVNILGEPHQVAYDTILNYDGEVIGDNGWKIIFC